MTERPVLEVLVSFLSKKDSGRTSLTQLKGYRPHFRILNDYEMLGVEFLDSPIEMEPSIPFQTIVSLLYYPEVTYEKMIIGAEFEIFEGPKIVGTGKVI